MVAARGRAQAECIAMRAEILRLDELTRRDLDAWRALGAAAAEPNPFFASEFVVPAAQGLGADDAGILAVRDRGGWAAAFPVHLAQRWRRVPVPTLAGWRHPYCFLGTPLVAADRLDAALDALLL